MLRRWVWPGLKFSVFAVIAVAMVRLAFFATEPPEPETRPTGAVADPTVRVEQGTIANDVTAKGAIRSVGATAVRATAAGTVHRLFVANGAVVAAGAPIADVRVETAPDTASADPDAPAPKPKVSYTTVRSTTAGTVSGLDLVLQQPVEIGTVVARVAPDAYRVAATLDAAQLYRLVSRPTEAAVAIKDGPAPFTCTGLTLTSAGTDSGSGAGAGSGDAAGAGAGDPGGDSGAPGGGTTLECDVPAGVTVFPGLEATVTVSAGTAKDVLTLPITAVSGTAEKGVVTTMSKGGERSPREVALGLNDGERVEVKDGLAEGDTVLEFVPGKERPAEDEATDGIDVGVDADGGSADAG